MRVALFAEWDLEAPGGLRTTTAGLVDHSPDDIYVIPYLNQPGLSSLLRVNELIARLQRQRIELVHIASCGHVALAALLLAAKLHPRCVFQARAAGIDQRGARAPRQLLALGRQD